MTILSQQVMVPAYIYPTLAGWTQYVNGAPTVSRMVANPSSGPGVSVNADYTTGIGNARAAGIQVLGYVDTNYGARSLGTVEADIDSWYSFYTIDGMMFDRVQGDSGHVSYYTSLYTYVKAKDASRNIVALNPGTLPIESYTSSADTICLFENNYAGWQSSWAGNTTASWIKNYAASKWWAIVYNVPDQSSMVAVLQSMKHAGVEYIFVTDQNGYTSAPGSSFWSSELANAKSLTTLTKTYYFHQAGVAPGVPGTFANIRLDADASGNTEQTSITPI